MMGLRRQLTDNLGQPDADMRGNAGTGVLTRALPGSFGKLPGNADK
jgi:hypothetical protein